MSSLRRIFLLLRLLLLLCLIFLIHPTDAFSTPIQLSASWQSRSWTSLRPHRPPSSLLSSSLHSHHDFSSIILTALQIDDLVNTPPSMISGTAQSIRSLVRLGMEGSTVLLILLIAVVFATGAQFDDTLDDALAVEEFVQEKYPEFWTELEDEYGEGNNGGPLETMILSPDMVDTIHRRLKPQLEPENKQFIQLLQTKYPDVWEDYKHKVQHTKSELQRAIILRAIQQKENIPDITASAK